MSEPGQSPGRYGGRAQKFTPEVFAAVPEWLRLGASPEDIAGVLDTTLNSLKVACSRAGVSLRASVQRPRLTPRQWDRLCREADRRAVPPAHLAASIVAAVVDDELFCAVLGDYDDLDVV